MQKRNFFECKIYINKTFCYWIILLQLISWLSSFAFALVVVFILRCSDSSFLFSSYFLHFLQFLWFEQYVLYWASSVSFLFKYYIFKYFLIHIYSSSSAFFFHVCYRYCYDASSYVYLFITLSHFIIIIFFYFYPCTAKRKNVLREKDWKHTQI